MITGETLRLFRMLKGIKQETVAKDLGISQPAYCKIEKSNSINDEKLQKILAVLPCCMEDLKRMEAAYSEQDKK